MKRKSSPIPPGVTMLSTEPMDFHIKKSNLGYHYRWRPDFKDFLTLKVKCTSVISYKASQSTIENNKGYLTHKVKASLEMEERAKNPTIPYHQLPTKFANVTPVITVQQMANEPISNIRVVGVSPYLGQKDEVLILLPGDYLYTMDMVSFVESVARGKVVDGEFKDEFIWCSTGQRLSLIRKDSPYHESLLKIGDE